MAILAFEFMLRQLVAGHETLDPLLGWTWRSETVIHRLNEGWGVSHWVADGSRRLPTQSTGKRVLVIGDSFAEAVQVNDDEVFSARLNDVTAVNIGRSSHSIADYVTFARDYMPLYHPDWTIVEIGTDDLTDDAFNREKTHFDAALNVIVVKGRIGVWSRRLGYIREKSTAVDYGVSRWGMYRQAARMPPLFRAADEQSVGSPRGQSVTFPPIEDEVTALLRSYRGRVTLLFIPRWNSARDEVERRLFSQCAREGLSCVNLRTTFPEFIERGDAPFGFPNSRFGEGHMNARGHAAAAALLNVELTRLRARGLF